MNATSWILNAVRSIVDGLRTFRHVARRSAFWCWEDKFDFVAHTAYRVYYWPFFGSPIRYRVERGSAEPVAWAVLPGTSLWGTWLEYRRLRFNLTVSCLRAAVVCVVLIALVVGGFRALNWWVAATTPLTVKQRTVQR